MFVFIYQIDVGASDRSQNPIQDKIQEEKPNPIKLKTQWDKTRAYVGESTKCGVRRQTLISSLTIPLWIMTESLLCTGVILNGITLTPYNMR